MELGRSVGRWREMLSSPIFQFFLGNLLGFFFGLIPGMHPNLVKDIFESFGPIFFVSLGTSYNFSQILLVSLLGYRMYGYIMASKEIKKFVLGGIKVSFLISLLFPFFFVTRILQSWKVLFPFILLIVSIHMIKKEKYWNVALIFFLTSGFIGYITLKFNLCRNPLLPLLSGLFGIPSMFRKEREEISYEKFNIYATLLASLLMVSIPSMTPVHASVIASDLLKSNAQSVIVSVNFVQVISSLYSWYFIDKPREGYLEILKNTEKSTLPILVLVSLLSLLISYLAYLFMKKLFVTMNLEKMKYIVIGINMSLVLYFSGIFGFFVFLASLLVGMECLERGISQIHCSGVIMVPTILWYLPT